MIRCFSCGKVGGLLFMGHVNGQLQPRHLGPCASHGMSLSGTPEGHEIIMTTASLNIESIEVHEIDPPDVEETEMLRTYAEVLGLEVLP